MQAIAPVQYNDLSGGMVTQVSDDLLPQNTATLSINLQYDVIGDVTQRSGTSLLGSQVSAGNGCDGLAQFISSDLTKNRLVAAFGGTNYAFDGASWSGIGGGMTPGIAVRYTSFWNNLYRVGGGQGTYSWNGSGSMNGVTGSPTGKYIMPYKQRLYIAGDPTYPNRLWFSTIADFNGSFTFDTTNLSEQYIDFTSGRANDVITGLGKISNLLIIFLNNVIYRWNGSSTDPEVIIDVGCSSQDSVVNSKGLIYFFNPSGFFTTDSGYPQEISRPIYDWIQGIDPANYGKIYGGQDADHVYWFVGDVTLTKVKRDSSLATGRTFKNVCIVYTISSKNWYVYSYANNLRFLYSYTGTDNAVSLVGGDTLGNVLKLNTGTTDYVSTGNSPIFYEWESKEEFFGSRSETDQINQMAWFMDNGKGAQVSVSSEGKPFETIGQITDRVTMFPAVNTKGHFFQFRLAGANIGSPIVFTGFEIFDATNLGYVRL